MLHCVPAGIALSIVFFSGCVSFAYPYTRADLGRDSERWPGRALVHYLGQPNADPGACDPKTPPGVSKVDESMVVDVASALSDRKGDPAVLAECITKLVTALEPAGRGRAMARVAPIYVRALSQDPPDEGALKALHGLVVLSEWSAGHPEALAASRGSLLRTLTGLRGFAASLATEALGAMDASVGLWRGEPVTASSLVAATPEDLAVLAVRLPKETERRLAIAERLRRLARVSSFPEVVADVETTVARVIEQGWNRVDVAARPPRKVTFAAKNPYRGLQLRQAVLEGTGHLFAQTIGAEGALDVVPTLQLEGWLQVDVGLSSPVTVCPESRFATTAPCVHADVIDVPAGLARLEGGRLVLADRVPLDEAIAWLDTGLIEVTVRVSGQSATHAFPVVFESAEALVLSGVEGGGPGPDIAAEVHSRGDAVIVTVSVAGSRYLAVAARSAPGPVFVTRGGAGTQGYAGASGMDGADGMDGHDATCYSIGGSGSRGGNGTSGQPGGPGGPGGDGGAVDITVRCRAKQKDCAALQKIARRLVISEGGPGGAGGMGGQGGRGGDGGRGGSSTSCREGYGANVQTTYRGGGIAGSRGMDGMSGSPGARGTDGVAGNVTVRVGR